MPDYTNYHTWTKPDSEADGWDEDYYNLLYDNDNKVPRTGPLTNRPVTARSGSLYWATDIGQCYRYTGSRWVALGARWHGMELVFGDSEPLSNQYLRLAPEPEDPGEASLAVSTRSPSELDTGIRLRGEITTLENTAAEWYFRYRPTGAASWEETAHSTRQSTGTISADLEWSNLVAGTTYEYYALAEADDGTVDTGSTVTFNTPEEDSSMPATTFEIDYDTHYDSSVSRNGLASAYDSVADTRSTGAAYLSQSAPTTTGQTANVQACRSGGCPAKSSNCLVELNNRVGSLPQEVYFEYDVLFDGNSFTLIDTDTYRFFWNMNRYSGNAYDSTSGNGFSNAIGVTPRGGPSSGSYHFFSYTYDSRGASNFWRTNFEIPTGEWFTLKGYVKCNDIGSSNAVMKYWYNDQLMQQMDGFQTSADQNGWCHEFGPTGYYTYCNATSYDRYVYFDQPRYWVDSDIPSDIRE